MTRPDPHASYREHVSTEAEAVEEDAPKPHRGKYTLIEVTELADLRAQLATARKALPKRAEIIAALKASHRNFMATGADRESAERYEDMADSMLNLFRAALNSGKQKQIEDWPYPEGNPTCAQDLK